MSGPVARLHLLGVLSRQVHFQSNSLRARAADVPVFAVTMTPSASSIVERLELPFNGFGVDPYGISKKHLAKALPLFSWFYRTYFQVKAVGIQRVPSRGRAMLVGNHSGGYAIDGMMTITAMMLDAEPPRLAQGMAEKFMNTLPISSLWTSRTGQFTGLPEHAERLLHDERLLMVFPEGAKGTAKLYKERYSLVDFGTGFMRLALKTKSPVVPFGFVGGGDAVPTVYNSKTLGKLLGVPYVPITPWGLALPAPAPCQVHFGEPMVFEGTGDEDDATVKAQVAQVKSRIAQLLDEARVARRQRGGDR